MAKNEMQNKPIDRTIWLYEVIRWHMDSEDDRAPVVRELMVMADLPSSAVVQHHLDVLRGWGWIAWTPHKSRTMRLTRPTDSIVEMPKPRGKRKTKNRVA